MGALPSALRVLVVSDASPVTVGSGGERVLWAHALGLVESGHEVRILSRPPSGSGPGVVERQGVRLRHFPVDRRSAPSFVWSSVLGARRAAGEMLAEEGADVLHLHHPLSALGVLGAPAARGIPSLYTFHSPAPLEYRARRGMSGYHRGGWVGGLAMTILWLIERACLRRASRIHVLSEFSAAHLWRLYRIPSERIVKIPGGVDADRFRPAPDPGAVRARLGVPRGMPLVFTLRNLEARMGVDALIEAAAIVRPHAPPFLLLVGGDGPLRGELQALAASRGLEGHVRFLGFVPEAELPDYYRAADVFVIPSRELEGFGLVTVEALASGTPVLGTPIGATPEILRPLRPGLVFRDVTPEAIAEGLGRFLDDLGRDPAGTRRLRESCRRHALAHYTWRHSVERIAATFRELVAPPARAPAPASCPACGDPLRGRRDLLYRGARYRWCLRCGSGSVSPLPTAAALRRLYETDYPRRYEHEEMGLVRAGLFAAVLDRLGARRRPGRLLDVGCGSGHLLEAAARRGWRAVGTELSLRTCAIALRVGAGSVVQADSTRAPFRDGCLDAVTLVNVVDHVLDPRQTLREGHRVLAPGGWLVVRVSNAAFHRFWARLLSSLGPVPRWRGWDTYPILHLSAFTPAGLRILAERAGFRVCELRNSPPSARRARGTPPGRGVGPWTWAAGLVTAGAACVSLVSGGRWLLGPSVELYAVKAPGAGEGGAP